LQHSGCLCSSYADIRILYYWTVPLTMHAKRTAIFARPGQACCAHVYRTSSTLRCAAALVCHLLCLFRHAPTMILLPHLPLPVAFRLRSPEGLGLWSFRFIRLICYLPSPLRRNFCLLRTLTHLLSSTCFLYTKYLLPFSQQHSRGRHRRGNA